MQTIPANQEAIEAWNTVLFDKFVRFRDIIVTGLAEHGHNAMRRYPAAAGERVVDLGCGFGDTTVELARQVGPSGRAIGLDAAPRFIAAAKAESTGVENASFAVADIEAEVPGGPYDVAFSRFGTMFFANPVFALRNVRKALTPAGRLVMVVWRKKDANPALTWAESIVKGLVGEPEHGDQVTCGPGPFSMASADVVSDQVRAAGFVAVELARSDTEMFIGKDVETAIDFSLTLGPAGELVRLAGDVAVARMPEIRAALARGLSEHASTSADGLRMAASAWIVVGRAS